MASKLQSQDRKPVFNFHILHRGAIPSLELFVLDSIHDYQDLQGFPDGSVLKSPPANAGDTFSIPDLGRSHIPRNN